MLEETSVDSVVPQVDTVVLLRRSVVLDGECFIYLPELTRSKSIIFASGS